MNWMLLTLGFAVVIISALAGEILQGLTRLGLWTRGILINSMVQVQYAMIQALGCANLTAKFHLLQLPLHSLVVW